MRVLGAASLLNYPTIALPILIKIKCEKKSVVDIGKEWRKRGGDKMCNALNPPMLNTAMNVYYPFSSPPDVYCIVLGRKG